MTLASVLSRPRHCALAALFWGMLYHNNIINPRGPKGAKKEKKLLQNIRKHSYKYVHFLINNYKSQNLIGYDAFTVTQSCKMLSKLSM